MLTPLESLKIKVQETGEDRSFTDEELINILSDNEDNVFKAAYMVCLMKANTEKSIKVGPIEIENYDPDYWNNLASVYLKEYKDSTSSSGYKNHMRRADGC